MSSELERRLEGLLADAPEPDRGAGEEALHRALRGIHPATRAQRGLRTAVLALAAAAVLLAIAAGSLAAAGALHVSFGQKTKRQPAITQLVLPRGANGIAAIVDGRLSVVTKKGFRLQGQAATAVALSPHALYIAAGIGHRLVAMAPSTGRRAWSHPAGGRVVAIAWAPDGLQIAYVVRGRNHLVLRLIYGNGRKDTIIDRSVRAIRPSWRADSLALAYVGAGGRAIVYDLSHERRDLVPVRAPVTGVAFPPRGDSLAVETPTGVWLAHAGAANTVTTGPAQAFGWLNRGLGVAAPSRVQLFTAGGTPRGSYRVRGIVVAVTPKLVLVRTRRSLMEGHSTLLSISPRTSIRDLQVG